MKTILTTIILAVASTSIAWAQMPQKSYGSMPQPSATQKMDTVKLSQTTDNGYVITNYLVRNVRNADSDFNVRYRINMSKLMSQFADNSEELMQLNTFMQNISRDTTMHITRIVITGHASPDGSYASNQKLAMNRAVDFKTYVDKRYNLSAKYPTSTEAVVDSWADLRPAIRATQTPNKSEILAIIDSNATPADKEMKIKKYTAAWNYIRTSILPKMRFVDMDIHFTKDIMMQTRVLMPQPKPAMQSGCCQCCAKSMVMRQQSELIVIEGENVGD